ncbi:MULTISPECIES: hypothetical protein [Pseudomonas]|jgi:hypothetical protein|uniref:Uncharacterized protein n=1 Tax=Pseudomonas sp. Hg7Tf TaxID=3236988 RepID=A0AB39I6J9_9PSED|nr:MULTISPECIES: hypothetical protein [Pseudomonas]KJK07706.1 hypothetical protein UB47_09655 [Pseudomonas sp. 5]MDD1979293.1 hypothetical protein [Pseudomonas putida]MDH2558442.1 hypothetical protein [Pseudomonas sp. Hg5Tf]QYX48300.1 hypothetical protein K3F43_01995 [Pseudomonas sp. S11A 273]
MLWFGTEKARFKLQRRIMGVVVFIAIFFLAVQIESYLSGCGTSGDVLDGLILTSFAGGMFYLAGKW